MTDDAPLLTVEGLTKYYGRRLGCADVAFDLYEGEILAIVGESGSGKSTLLQLLSGQLEPSTGRILYRMRDGAATDIWEMSEPTRRHALPARYPATTTPVAHRPPPTMFHTRNVR